MIEQKTIILPMTDTLKTALHVLPKTKSKKKASNSTLCEMVHVTNSGDMITSDGYRLIIINDCGVDSGTYKLVTRDSKTAILCEHDKLPPNYNLILDQDFAEVYKDETTKNNHACAIIRLIKDHDIDIDFLSETLSAIGPISSTNALKVGVNNNETTIKIRYKNYTAIIMLIQR